MTAFAAVCFVIFTICALGVVIDKVNQRADELRLTLDGVIERLDKLEKK